MVSVVLETLPAWVIQGIVLGFVVSLVVAGLFYVMVRFFPSETPPDEQRVDGDSRRRTEIRDYLDAIDEHYTENQYIDGQSVAFYLPARDVAITFDARSYYAMVHADTEAVLVEHEMPGVALGYRLPFDTPEVDSGPDPTAGDQPPGMAEAHAALELPVGASAEEVRRAYREKIKEVHPDQGGDEEEFKRIREAYATAREHAS